MNVEGEPQVQTTLNYYNWMQAIENNMDTSHNPILHFGAVTPENFVFGSSYGSAGDDVYYMVKDRTARFLVQEHDVGASYGAFRAADPGTNYWRTMHWLFPFFTMSPVPKLGTTAWWVATVPVDDFHNMQWSMRSVIGEGAFVQNFSGPNPSGGRFTLPNTSDWLGRFRNPLSEQVETDFGIDRQKQHDKPPSGSGFTGLPDVNTQDEAMKWGQGRADNNGIVRRDIEHLGTTDAMIIRVRRKLLDAAKALRDQGTTPPGVDTPVAYRLRSGWVVMPEGVDWWEASRELREGFKRQLETSPAS
jgi:hypothetical protein